MIFTITPNAAIDKTYVVESFQIDKVHRPIDQHTVAGGKGINVTRVYRTLGGESIASGFIGGKTGISILRMLEEEGMPHDFVNVKEESRLCIAIMDRQTNTQTELNENGPNVSASEIKKMLDKIEQLRPDVDTVVMCGSCPPGVPFTFYGNIIDIARKRGFMSLLDASGKHLAEAVKHSPDIVKPNMLELSHILGEKVSTFSEAAEGAVWVAKAYKIGMVVVTMGKDGCVATDGTDVWISDTPPIKFASAVGSGDSFAAGLLFALSSGAKLPDAIKLATAAGAANAATYGAGFCTKCSIMELEKCVSVRKIN